MVEQDETEKYKERIRHNYSAKFYSRSANFCGKNLKHLLFDDVVVKGIENVLEVQDKQLFYVSNHISLADFLVQGYVFWKYDLPIPRFIAGENLFHFPFKTFWKKCGAIALDRKGGLSYMKVFKNEVENYLSDGESLLPYPEGGRNYKNEEVRKFKTGLFGPLLDAVNKGKDIYVVPMRSNYDKRIEQPFLAKIQEYRKKRDDCLSEGRKVAAKFYDLCYFWTDVRAYLSRFFDREKGNAYLTFGKAFNDFDKKKKNLVAERVREEIMNLGI